MNPDNSNFRDRNCRRCEQEFSPKQMKLKMGGLLCPKCDLILISNGELIYINEVKRRESTRHHEESVKEK